MKKYIYTLIALLLIATGCRKDKPVDHAKLVIGEWHCVPGTFEADVYLAIDEAGTFDLYQQIGEGRHRHYSGEWTINDDVLSGTYSDGQPWGSEYQVSFSGSNTMTMKALNGSDELMDYYREAIPSEIIDGSIIVKSAYGADFSPVL